MVGRLFGIQGLEEEEHRIFDWASADSKMSGSSH